VKCKQIYKKLGQREPELSAILFFIASFSKKITSLLFYNVYFLLLKDTFNILYTVMHQINAQAFKIFF